MNELDKLKIQANIIMSGETNDFIILSHDYAENDIWNIMVRSELTGKYYTFKNCGSEFYDFNEKH